MRGLGVNWGCAARVVEFFGKGHAGPLFFWQQKGLLPMVYCMSFKQ